MTEIVIEVAGDPKGKPRARFRRFFDPKTREWKVHVHSDEEQAGYEGLLHLQAQRVMGQRVPLNCAVSIEVTAVFHVPLKSWPKWRQERALKFGEPHTSRPDMDNVVKMVKDALKGVVYRDDSLVSTLRATKLWGAKPGIFISIEAIPIAPREQAARPSQAPSASLLL